MPQDPVYLDANGTTVVPESVKKAMCNWINRGNPSSAYAGAEECRDMIAEFRDHIARLCGVISVDAPRQADNPRAYHIVITSGASESNSTILRSVAEAYRLRTRRKPHIVSSQVEHKCILQCLARLEETGAADVTLLPVDASGIVAPADLRAALKSNTALVSIMGANNETGAINNLRALGIAAADAKVPFHSDAAQLFGKAPFLPIEDSVSAFSLSMHKVYGPKGVGVLAIRQDFANGYQLRAIIHGSQNDGMRGGTENVAGIAGAIAGLHFTFTNLSAKLDRLAKMRGQIVRALARAAPVVPLADFIASEKNSELRARPPLEFVVLTPGVEASGAADRRLALPNTLLLSVVSRKHRVCNSELRKTLQDKGFIVSIGSACNTASPKASHVIRAMGADDVVARGTLRVSLSHTTRMADAKKFAEALIAATKKYA